MNKRVLLYLIYNVFLLHREAEAITLSPQARVSLLTASPGQDLYAAFGHSALWIDDPINGINAVYGYGTYNFNQPNFYVKFVKGQLEYELSVTDIHSFLASYQHESRSVIQQVLNLSLVQKNKLYTLLENNYLPENRSYRYDFFFDNCSTRIRDVLQKVVGRGLTFHLKSTKPKSFRQLIDQYLNNHDYEDLGMDIGLGAPADRIASSYEYMFLPDYLMQGFESATFQTGTTIVPLVMERRILYQAPTLIRELRVLSSSQLVWILFGIGFMLTIQDILKKRTNYLVDAILFGLTGMLGLLLVFLWWGTDHKVTIHNWNLIWAFPFLLPLSFLLLRKTKITFIYYFFIFYGILLAVLLVSWSWLPQELPSPLIPWILLLLMRSFYLLYKTKQDYPFNKLTLRTK